MIECKNIDCKEDPLLKSIKLNYVFYSILLACLFIISHYTNSSFFWCIITFMYVSFSGYFTHYLSHTINLTEMYKGYLLTKSDNYLSKIPGMESYFFYKRVTKQVVNHRVCFSLENSSQCLIRRIKIYKKKQFFFFQKLVLLLVSMK